MLIMAAQQPLAAQETYIGDVRIETRIELDAFVDEIEVFGYTHIDGSLEIVGNFGRTDITDLTGLEGLTSISGRLYILYNEGLQNLDGLSGLQTVGGELRIDDNELLRTLDGLSGVTSVGGELEIVCNETLLDLNGLSGITTVPQGLQIAGNPWLQNLDGLSGITTVGGRLQVAWNESLQDLHGLSGITSAAGNLIIRTNRSLSDLNGLNGIGTIGGDLFILDNQSLSNFCGLVRLLHGDSYGEVTIDNNLSHPSIEEILAACDSDRDGVPDFVDDCPISNTEESVAIRGMTVAVENRVDRAGCTLNDRLHATLNEERAIAETRSKFIRAMTQYLSQMKSNGLISGRERSKLKSAVRKAYRARDWSDDR